MATRDRSYSPKLELRPRREKELFAGPCCSVCRGGLYALNGQHRVLGQDLIISHPDGETVQNNADWNPGSSDACLSMHHIGVNGDHIYLLSGHGAIVGPTEHPQRQSCVYIS